ncbi:MAG: DUF6600 domain-containing protein [Terriglobia bacterium]
MIEALAAQTAAPDQSNQIEQGDQSDPPDRAARISFISGKVSLQPAGVSDWSEATLNYPMTTNDRIYTDQGARAELEVGSSAVRLGPATDLTIANLSDQFMQLGLAQGTIRVSIYHLLAGNSVEVDTPNGALTLTQQGYYRVETYPDQNTTLVRVDRGAVELSGANLSGTVGGGQAVKLTGSGPIDLTYVSLPREDELDRWSAERDRACLDSASLRYVSPETPGYSSLDGYGVWSETLPYGPVWYPTRVPAGWAPYRFGHWVWVSPWGWTWVDDEPWGFAPFHYGRWVSYRGRWGWLPGPVVSRPYYAPALVAFVGGAGLSVGVGGGVGFTGWFPLGPREPFLPWYHSGPRYVRQVNVTNVRNIVNVTNFVNARNVTTVRYANQRLATTVVRANTFRSGAPVRSAMVRVSPAKLTAARVIPHPEVNPAQRAVMGGTRIAAPVRTARFAPVVGARPITTRAPETRRAAPPSAAETRRAVPPSAAETRRAVPPSAAETQRAAPPIYSRPAARAGEPAPYRAPETRMPPTSRPQLFTRRQPAAPSVPFAARERAREQHPGRPLEPQQVQNLRQGRPAGPMRDREYIPHAAPQASRPASQASRPARQESRPARQESRPSHSEARPQSRRR